MKSPCIAALCAGSAIAAPSVMFPVALADGGAVRNGSFDAAIDTVPGWFRSEPCLEQIGHPESGCEKTLPARLAEPARFISVGPSVVHDPEAIERGTLPLPVGVDGPARACPVETEERRSVLRMRLNHPNAPYESVYTSDLFLGVGNVYQTDIFLPGMEGDALDGHAVVLRFDHLGLHPTGGAALKVRLIAERIRGENGQELPGVDWGADPSSLPFQISSGSDLQIYQFNSLGTAFLECDDRIWRMPRQLPLDCDEIALTCPASDCAGGESGIPLKPSILGASVVDDMPLAGWRTNELKVAVQRLPDWDCSAGLEQLDAYRFTIAFALPEEIVYLGPGEVQACGSLGDWVSPVERDSYRQSKRSPAYSEIDAVQMGLALVAEAGFHTCDFPFDGFCGPPSSSLGDCPATVDGAPQAYECNFQPQGGGLSLEWDSLRNGEGPFTIGVESARTPSRLVYHPTDPSGPDGGHRVQIGMTCYDFLNATTYLRRMSEFDFDLVEFLKPDSTCIADFNGDGLVDGRDFGVLLGEFGCRGDCVADLDGDARVDGADIGLFGAFWGPCE